MTVERTLAIDCSVRRDLRGEREILLLALEGVLMLLVSEWRLRYFHVRGWDYGCGGVRSCW